MLRVHPGAGAEAGGNCFPPPSLIVGAAGSRFAGGIATPYFSNLESSTNRHP